jgi:hypothetical protein
VLQLDPDVDTVAALGSLADVEILDGRPDAERLAAEALAMAQALEVDPAVVALLFISCGITNARANRMAEAALCYAEAARLAERAGHEGRLGWALANLSDALGGFDSHRAAKAARTAAEHARHIGARRLLGLSTLNLTMALLELGEWDDADAVLVTATQHDQVANDVYVVFVGGLLGSLRGDGNRASGALACLPNLHSSGNAQEQACIARTGGLPHPLGRGRPGGCRSGRGRSNRRQPALQPADRTRQRTGQRACAHRLIARSTVRPPSGGTGSAARRAAEVASI